MTGTSTTTARWPRSPLPEPLPQPAASRARPARKNRVRRTPRAYSRAVPRYAPRTTLLAATSGVFGETAAGVTLGALRTAVAAGQIGADDRVVLLVTGDGLKTQKMPGHWVLARLGKRVLRPGGVLSSLGVSMLLLGIIRKLPDRVLGIAAGMATRKIK